MFYALILVRIIIAAVLVMANFLPWMQLDDAINTSNGLDLAIYGFTGADRSLFFKQNAIMAIGLFILPLIIMIMTTWVSINLIVNVIKGSKSSFISNIIDFTKIIIPIIFLIYFISPFVDDTSYKIYMYAVPHIGLLLLVCSAFFLVASDIIYEYIIEKSSDTDKEE